MLLESKEWFIDGGYLLSALMLMALPFIYFRSDRPFEHLPSTEKINWPLSIYILFAFVLSTYPRILSATNLTHGQFVFEELSASIVYANGLYNGTHTYTGFTQSFFALLLDLWRAIFGYTAVSSRWLSGALGILGIILFYLSFSKIRDKRLALIFAALLSNSVFATFFSRLAVETSWSLAVLALNLYLFSIFLEKKQKLYLVFLGVSVAVGMFTYPGYTASLPGFLIPLWLVTYSQSSNQDLKSFFGWRPLTVVSATIIAMFLPVAFSHYRSEKHDVFLLPGQIALDLDQYIASLKIIYRDIFIRSDSYFMAYENFTFIEASFWAFVLLGLIISLKRTSWWVDKWMAGSFFVLPLFIGAAVNMPGMRRGLLFLVPSYYLASRGMLFLSSLISIKKMRYINYIFALVLLGSAYISYREHKYTITVGRATPSFSPLSELIFEDDFVKALSKYKVILYRKSWHEFEGQLAEANSLLLKRYGRLDRSAQVDLQLASPKELATFNANKENLVYVFDYADMERFRENLSICFQEQESHNYRSFAYYTALIRVKGTFGCQ